LIVLTNGKYDMASKNAISGLRSSKRIMGLRDVFDLKWARNGIIKL
jgi:hypothetical protein